MAGTAYIFPGQGSQYVGMGKDCYDRSPVARRIMDLADELLGVPLTRICFEGPEDELKQTKNTQPAIFLHSVVLLTLLRANEATMVAGHSLGEYSALVAAGALDVEEGLRLVRLRGELMQEAGRRQKGTMAAIVGLSPEVLERICSEASSEGVVRCANFNSPGQIVISGSIDGVRKAMELCKDRGARMVKELVVSGAFHSPLMESAREGFRDALAVATLRDARIPVYANVTAEPVQKVEEIRTLLERQLTNPVRWEQSVAAMSVAGAERFVEVGPGKVLQGLVKRINGSVEVVGINSFTDVTAMKESIG